MATLGEYFNFFFKLFYLAGIACFPKHIEQRRPLRWIHLIMSVLVQMVLITFQTPLVLISYANYRDSTEEWGAAHFIMSVTQANFLVSYTAMKCNSSNLKKLYLTCLNVEVAPKIWKSLIVPFRVLLTSCILPLMMQITCVSVYAYDDMFVHKLTNKENAKYMYGDDEILRCLQLLALYIFLLYSFAISWFSYLCIGFEILFINYQIRVFKVICNSQSANTARKFHEKIKTSMNSYLQMRDLTEALDSCFSLVNLAICILQMMAFSLLLVSTNQKCMPTMKFCLLFGASATLSCAIFSLLITYAARFNQQVRKSISIMCNSIPVKEEAFPIKHTVLRINQLIVLQITNTLHRGLSLGGLLVIDDCTLIMILLMCWDIVTMNYEKALQYRKF